VLSAAVTNAQNLYEYHYTLYYYDQSDNLVKTIPCKKLKRQKFIGKNNSNINQDNFMNVLKEIQILKIKEYGSFGIMATIKFLNKKIPKIGEVIECQCRRYKIIGIILSSDSIQINFNMDENIYECKLKELI